MGISQILKLQKLLLFCGKETTVLLSVRRWMCIRANEESLFCAASITFLPQKTADILNYAQKQRATQKNEQCMSPSPSSSSGSKIHPL